MNFLLKIVEGPNKGAEIALVENIAVTLGKADDCDIILADPTLPDAPFRLEATAAGVTLDGEAIEPFHVKSAGSTAFAVGPSDAAWGELVWPQAESAPTAEEHEAADAGRGDEAAASGGDLPRPPAEPEPTEAAPEKHRRGWLGCLVLLIVILLLLLGAAWFFRDALRPRVEALWGRLTGKVAVLAADTDGEPNQDKCPRSGDALSAVAAKYGLSLTNDAGRVALSGNFRTRAERLAATAEAYESQPGVELDLSDDESFRTAAEDALFTLTEGALKVSAATNRYLTIVGSSLSAIALKKTLEALNADLPRLRDVDVSGVRLGLIAAQTGESIDPETGLPVANPARRKPKVANPKPNIPVCGILTMPYPCLVMKNGARIFEGATVGDSVIMKIEADAVTVTNANGRFTWKP